MALLEQPIYQCSFPMIDVGDNCDIAYVISSYQIFSVGHSILNLHNKIV